MYFLKENPSFSQDRPFVIEQPPEVRVDTIHNPAIVCVDKFHCRAEKRSNVSKKLVQTLGGRAWNTPTGAGLPGPGCVSHYLTTETFSAHILIHIQVSPG